MPCKLPRRSFPASLLRLPGLHAGLPVSPTTACAVPKFYMSLRPPTLCLSCVMQPAVLTDFAFGTEVDDMSVPR